jgi:formimidoylglutamate deiminase
MEMNVMKYLVPEYIYTPEGLQADRIIAIGDDGRISALLSSEEMAQLRVEQTDVVMLPGVALLPGFVNVHSHVFQRALRGHTHRPISGHDTFWTWRRAMYAEAQQLNPDRLYKIALSTYSEMLAAGYTSVGEFHYVHYQPDGQPYADPNAMSQAILSAGRDAGIRVILLMAAYAQSGFNTPPEPEQLRFVDASVEAYLERVESLRVSGVPVGVAPHSVRAVPGAWFRAIASYSHEHHLPLHVHAAEQTAEVEQSQAAYGIGPIELLERFGALGKQTTIIHTTHANAHEIDLLAGHGCTVCVCPTTEGDLGDGIAPYAGLLAAGIPLSIGSDSNTRIDPIEELRWAEYTARMRYQRRRVLVADERDSPGPFLLAMGTRQGAAALGIEAGSIAPGKLADLVAIDLSHPSLNGWTHEDLLDVLFFGVSADVIAGTWVNGRRVAN